MAIVSISPVLQGQAFDNLGNPLSGAKVFAYVGGSFSSLADTWTTAAGDVTNSNPVVADSSGRIPSIFLEVDTTYNLVLTLNNGTTVLQTYENVSGAPTSTVVQDLINSAVTGFVPDTGGTITGSLTVSGVVTGGSIVSNGSLSVSSSITAPTIVSAGISANSGRITSVATPTTGTDAANKNYVDTTVLSGGVPIGTIITWAATTPPANWLICNGQSISRTTYASLFSVLGTLYGSVDGSSFNVPDYRGSFLRGLDSGAGLDPARALGDYQADEYKAHTHTINADNGGFNVGTNNVSGTDRTTTSYTPPTNSSGGSETRPKNWSVQFLIRAL